MTTTAIIAARTPLAAWIEAPLTWGMEVLGETGTTLVRQTVPVQTVAVEGAGVVGLTGTGTVEIVEEGAGAGVVGVTGTGTVVTEVV